MPYKSELRLKISKEFLIISCFVSLVFTFSFIIRFYTEKQVKIKLTLENSVNNIANILDNDITYVEYQMRHIAKQIKDKPNDKEFILDILAKYRGYQQINTMISWTNKDFFAIVDGNEGILPKAIDLSHRDYIPKTKSKPKKLHFGKPVFGFMSKQWLIPAGMGISDNEGKYLGAIVFGFDISSMLYKLKGMNKFDGFQFKILDKNLNIIAESIETENNNYLKKISEINLEKDKSGLLLKSKIFDSNKNYYFYQKLDNYPYIIIGSFDKKLFEKYLFNKLPYDILGVTTIILASIILLFLLQRRIIKPVQKLCLTIDDIADGKKNIEKTATSNAHINELTNKIFTLKKLLEETKAAKLLLEKEHKIINKSDQAKEKFLQEIHNHSSIAINEIISNIDELIKHAKGAYTNVTLAKSEELNILIKIYQSAIKIQNITKDELNPVKLDIKKIIQEALSINGKNILKNNIQISTQFDHSVDTIMADEFLLKKIISDTLAHTLYFLPKDKKINISYKRQKKDLIIDIIDNGLGLDEEEKIMLLFDYNNNESINIGYIRNLVEQHGGKFEISTNRKQTAHKIIIPIDCRNFLDFNKRQDTGYQNNVVKLNQES